MVAYCGYPWNNKIAPISILEATCIYHDEVAHPDLYFGLCGGMLVERAASRV